MFSLPPFLPPTYLVDVHQTSIHLSLRGLPLLFPLPSCLCLFVLIHQFLEPLVEFFSEWCGTMDRGCDRRSTSPLQVVSSIFEALKTLLQLYGTTCAPMLRESGREVLDFILRRFSSAQVCVKWVCVEEAFLFSDKSRFSHSPRG